jgi:N-6 DNA Methylase
MDSVASLMQRGRKGTNEQEFQGEVLNWINAELSRRHFGLEKATQEKPRITSGKRNDLVIWKDRASEVAFLELELKGPSTALNDPLFIADAIEKGQYWSAPYFAIWNMQAAELYRTPALHEVVTPAETIYRSPILPVANVEDWLKPSIAKRLKAQALEIIEQAWQHSETGAHAGYAIDPEIFVARLSTYLVQLRAAIYKSLSAHSAKSRALRRNVSRIAAEQGFKGFVMDEELAISGQIAYRLIGQILFYHALKRKQPDLRPLTIDSSDQIPNALQTYWNDVRRYDYEALFKTEVIDGLISLPAESQALIRRLIVQLSTYDWGSLTDDVLGRIFERLIPREEQVLLGQFYTPRPVADLLVGLTVEEEWPTVVDPGCGSGTFLLGAYDYLRSRSGRSHSEALSIIWGFDLSPFATELSAINLFRQDMTEFDNFPRVFPGSFFERKLGQIIEFPPSQVTAASAKVPLPIPEFRCFVGNPPYLRSQN